MQTVSGALGSSGFRDSDLGLRVDALFCGVPEDPGVMEFLHLLQSKALCCTIVRLLRHTTLFFCCLLKLADPSIAGLCHRIQEHAMLYSTLLCYPSKLAEGFFFF